MTSSLFALGLTFLFRLGQRTASGQQELSTTSAQQGLALAESTGDPYALLQLWLLMAALEGRSVEEKV